MLVVATTPDDVERARRRLLAAGVTDVEVVAPGSQRRLLLAGVADPHDAHRLAAELQAEGGIAVVRPDGGAQLTAWSRDTEPVMIGERLGICVAWSEHPRRRIEHLIELGPGGFGNGAHPTTRMLLDALLRRLRGRERVLDVGCGSGVLGLAALAVGAGHVTAMDLKPSAVEATRRNAAINGLADRVDATTTPVDQLAGPFDVIVANVGRAVVVDIAGTLVGHLSPAGWLAVSGITPGQVDQIAEFLGQLRVVERHLVGEWATAVLTR
ncbi:MAG: 50S ribosomal protein L11 methyltransferase [Ilumatobacteraceae bacterium]